MENYHRAAKQHNDIKLLCRHKTTTVRMKPRIKFENLESEQMANVNVINRVMPMN